MAKLMSPLALMAVMLCGASAAMAQTTGLDPLSTQALYGECTSGDPVKNIECSRYLTGIFDVLDMLGTVAEDPSAPLSRHEALGPIAICREGSTTSGALVQIFVNWAQRNPVKWQRPRSLGAMDSLLEAWPCK